MPGASPSQVRLNITRYLPYDVPDTSGGSGGGTVATVTALALLPTLGLVDNELVWVTGRRRYFRWSATSSAAALDGEIVVPSTNPATGRWVSMDETSSIENALQTAWVVDPIAGSDDNATGPLATLNEFCRRIVMVLQPLTLTINSTCPDTDNLIFNPRLGWAQTLSALVPNLTVQGVVTLGAALLVAASTNEVGNVPPTITVAAAVWTPGTLLQATDGAQLGATAVVVADLGAGVARTTPWRSTAGVRVAPPALNDHIAVRSTPTINTVSYVTPLKPVSTATGVGVVSDLDIKAIGVGRGGDGPSFRRCTFGGTQSVVPSTGAIVIFQGCSFTTTGTVGATVSGASLLFRLCGIIRASTTILWGSGARGEYSDCVLQATSLECGASGGGTGLLQLTSCGIINAMTKAIDSRNGFLVRVTGTLYGSGPTVVAYDTSEGARTTVGVGLTPTLTGAIELRIEGAATAIPALAAGAGVPAASAFTTWANWAAAPFTRNVMDYKTGTAICNAAA